MSKDRRRSELTRVIDPRQDLFAALYFSPRINGKPNALFGNAYQAAIKAGFPHNTAVTMVAASKRPLWIDEAYKRMAHFKPEHTIKQLEDIANNHEEYTRDRLKALEMLGKIQGVFIDRQQTEVNVTFTNSVPRPVDTSIIDAELIDTTIDTEE